MHFLSLPTLSIHLISPALAVYCYFPDGTISGADVPCNPLTANSACCFTNQACLSNGLCQAGSAETGYQYARGTCTDQTWQSDDCPNFCLDHQNLGNAMYSCNVTGVDEYCCNEGCSCASGGSEEIVSFTGQPYTMTVIARTGTWTTPSASMTGSSGVSSSKGSASATESSGSITATPSSSASGSEIAAASDTSTSAPAVATAAGAATSSNLSSSSASASSASSNSHATAIGVGVGVGVGLTLLILAAGAYFVFLRRRKQRAITNQNVPNRYSGKEAVANQSTTNPTSKFGVASEMPVEGRMRRELE